MRATEANDDCLVVQETFKKSTLKSSEQRKISAGMLNDTINGRRPPIHGHNMPQETVTIESDSDDVNGETRDMPRSEPSKSINQ